MDVKSKKRDILLTLATPVAYTITLPAEKIYFKTKGLVSPKLHKKLYEIAKKHDITVYDFSRASAQDIYKTLQRLLGKKRVQSLAKELKKTSFYLTAQQGPKLKDYILLGRKETGTTDIFSHELGHVLQRYNPTWKTIISQPATFIHRYRLLPFVPGLLTLGYGIGSRFKNKKEKLGYKVPIIAGALGGALYTPVLIEEAGASIRGYRKLKQLGATAKELARARKKLLSAFGTYAANLPLYVTLPIAVTAAMNLFRGK